MGRRRKMYEIAGWCGATEAMDRERRQVRGQGVWSSQTREMIIGVLYDLDRERVVVREVCRSLWRIEW